MSFLPVQDGKNYRYDFWNCVSSHDKRLGMGEPDVKVLCDYIDFILDKFSSLEAVTARKMFGGYVLHMAGKVLGFVFDDTFLFEPGPTIDGMLPDAERRELFPGSKLFVVIDESFSSRRLCELARACYDDLPLPKPRKKKNQTNASEKKRQKEIEREFPFAKKIKW